MLNRFIQFTWGQRQQALDGFDERRRKFNGEFFPLYRDARSDLANNWIIPLSRKERVILSARQPASGKHHPEVTIELVGITNSESLREVVDEETISDASQQDRLVSAKELTITEPVEEDAALSNALPKMQI